MTRETTHRRNKDTGHYVQLVSPERLREILLADGETLDPPSGFGPEDEWDVGEDELALYTSQWDPGAPEARQKR